MKIKALVSILMIVLFVFAATGCAHMTTTDKIIFTTGFIAMGVLMSQDDNFIDLNADNCITTRYIDIRNTKTCD